MKHSVTTEAEAAGRKIKSVLHSNAYAVLGFIVCACLLAVVLSRPKALEGLV